MKGSTIKKHNFVKGSDKPLFNIVYDNRCLLYKTLVAGRRDGYKRNSKIWLHRNYYLRGVVGSPVFNFGGRCRSLPFTNKVWGKFIKYFIKEQAER